MRVDVALFASLSGFHHSQEGTGHTRTYDLDDGTTISNVVEMLELPDQPRIVFVNNKHAEETSELLEGQRLAIFPPVAGG